MVAALDRTGAIGTDAIRRALLTVPREHFVPELADLLGLEAVYRPSDALVTVRDVHGAPISSSSAPDIMALMLGALRLHAGMRVLEVGAGTGYNAALLATVVGTRGRVTSVELEPAIARRARDALAAGGYRCHVVVGDGNEGWASDAPFDRIIVTASAATVRTAWRDQLVDRGLLEVPLRTPTDGAQQVTVFRRDQGLLRPVQAIPAHFMPLRASG
jgi:protein-L-isoaspartate(D-aspartate) O-methyltransferase